MPIKTVEFTVDDLSSDIAKKVNSFKNHNVLLKLKDVIISEQFISSALEIFNKDPLIAFVNPRVNGNSIYAPDSLKNRSKIDSEEIQIITEICKSYPMAFSYIPVAECFCVMIRSEVLIDFEFVFENQAFLIYANHCNKYGYRSTIDNHNFAYFKNLSSFFQKRDQKSHEFTWGVNEYLTSLDFKFTNLYFNSNLSKKIKFLIDISDMPTSFNGTSKIIIEFIKALSKIVANRYKQFSFYLALNKVQHQLLKNQNCDLSEFKLIQTIEQNDFKFTLKLGQPWSFSKVRDLSQNCLFNFYYFYDTIATDCYYIRSKCGMLNEVWDLISQNSCVIFFISQFSKNQFELRYQGQAKKKTILLPFISDNPVLDNTSDSDNPQKNSYILIVGNHLPHKGLLETASRLANQENISKIIILGLKIDNLSTKIISFESGQLSNTEIFELYSNAQLIIYPSHYEGFGFPIIEALSLNKHIFARNLPAYREIQSNIAIKNNLFLYKHIEDLMEQISSFDNKTSYKYQPLISITWESTTIELIGSIIQHAEDPKNLLNTYYRTKNLYFIEKFWLDSRPINKLPSIEFLLKKIKYIIKNFQRNFLN